MSRFLSPKFLRARSSALGPPIDHDLACAQCGYNLRGLAAGRRCPECGHAPGELVGGDDAPRSRGPLVDLLGEDSGRGRWLYGLGLAVICVVGWPGLCVIRTALVLPGLAADLDAVTAIGNLVLAALWLVAVALVLSARITQVWPWTRSLRWAALLTQPLWIVAAVLLVAALARPGGVPGRALLIPWAAQLVAFLGSLVVGAMLAHLAEEAELETAARRLNLALWVMPFALGAYVATSAIFPQTLSMLTPTPWGFIFLLVRLPPVLALAAWCWTMGLAAIALLAMRRHVAWSERDRRHATGREVRISQTRREMDATVEATVRDVPAEASGEIRLTPPRRTRGGDGPAQDSTRR